MRIPVRIISVIFTLNLLLIGLFSFYAVCQEKIESEPSGEGGKKTPDFIEDVSKQALVEAEKIIEQAKDVFGGRAIIVGLNWGQANLTFNRDQPLTDETMARAALTDNGRFNLLFQYETAESFLFEIPLLIGKIGVGYNLIFGLSAFETDQQQVDNVFQGENLGSRSNGYYLKASPLLFIKLGPMTRKSKIFWKFGVGIGGAVMNFDADVIYQGEMVSEQENISHKFESLNLFIMTIAEILINNWSILYRAETITGGKYQNGGFVFDYFFFGLGYRIKF